MTLSQLSRSTSRHLLHLGDAAGWSSSAAPSDPNPDLGELGQVAVAARPENPRIPLFVDIGPKDKVEAYLSGIVPDEFAFADLEPSPQVTFAPPVGLRARPAPRPRHLDADQRDLRDSSRPSRDGALQQKMIYATLLQRATTLDDVGRGAAFLASDQARSITSTQVNISGGALVD
jgi:hypothetical protein